MPAQVQPAEADRLDALLLEPRQPGVVAGRRSRRRPCTPASLSHSSTYAAGSAASRCTTQASQPLPVEPAGDPLLPRLAATVHPVGEHLGASRRARRWRGAPVTTRRTISSPGQPGVAVDQPLVGGRRDHERRVGHDQVEPLARHRLEEAARRGRRRSTSLRAALSRVIGQRPLVDVGGHDPRRRARPGAAPARRSRCRGRAPGPTGSPHGQLGQRRGGRARCPARGRARPRSGRRRGPASGR